MGRVAAKNQIASLLTSATSAPHALPANLAKWNRDDTPKEDLARVFFALNWIPDVALDQNRTGPKRMTRFGMEIVLTTYMDEAAVVHGDGDEGASGLEDATDRLMTYFEILRWRLEHEAYWDRGTTGIVNVANVGSGARVIPLPNERRVEKRFALDVYLDETVT